MLSGGWPDFTDSAADASYFVKFPELFENLETYEFLGCTHDKALDLWTRWQDAEADFPNLPYSMEDLALMNLEGWLAFKGFAPDERETAMRS